jgi:hypothetical protein
VRHGYGTAVQIDPIEDFIVQLSPQDIDVRQTAFGVGVFGFKMGQDAGILAIVQPRVGIRYPAALTLTFRSFLAQNGGRCSMIPNANHAAKLPESPG